MSKDTKSDQVQTKSWSKPHVKSITPLKRTMGGAVARTIEDPFYNPS